MGVGAVCKVWVKLIINCVGLAGARGREVLVDNCAGFAG